MLYSSTKGQSAPVSLPRAILTSTADDGGLYIPQQLPVLPGAFIANSADMQLADIAFAVLDTLIGDELDGHALKQVIDESFNFDLPMVGIGDGLYALELFHGPTLSVKDISARFMAQLSMQLSRKYQRSTALNVLVATTGNAGGAVADAIANLPDTNVFILFPRSSRNYVGDNIRVLAPNVKAVEIQGSIDDCHRIVAEALADRQLRESVRLTTANSVNIARILPQIALHFYAASRLLKAGMQPAEVPVAIPTGNMSGLTAAIMARRMGAPMGRIIAATNANDFLSRYILDGDLIPGTVTHTAASAMDIGYPTSMPRLLALCHDNRAEVAATVEARSVDDDTILSTIRDINTRYGYLADPNTATAIAALSDSRPALVMATGHPAKAKDVVERATGTTVRIPERLAYASRLRRHAIKLAPTYPALRKLLLTTNK